ncbi:Speckle-type POZ protein [Formica fusca]
MNITEDTTHHGRTQLESSIFSYTWSISNFWEIREFISELYGDEIKNYFRLYVSFKEDKLEFYAMTNSKEKIRVSYSVFSLNTTETKLMSKHATNFFVDKYLELLYELSISDLKSNSEKYLSEGVFTICFKFCKFDNLINNSICYSYKPGISVTEMQSFVSNEKSDSLVTFVINNEHLQVSKALLCSKSEVFKAMFNYDLTENINNKVEIIDIKYDILQQLLFFLQTGCLSEDVREDTEIACELMIAAEKYDIKDLKLICEQYLITNTTKENVVEHLKIAHLNNGTTLKKYALDFIKLYLKDIVDTPNFITLMQEYHELLLQIENIQLPIIQTLYVLKFM